MKKFIATFALVATVMGVQAQSETKDFVNYERGYRADIAVSTSIGCETHEKLNIHNPCPIVAVHCCNGSGGLFQSFRV